MNTITHALVPVIMVHVCLPRSKRFGRWSLVAIGFAGALPDLLTPHFTLEARMMSWSHGLPFWSALTCGLLVVSFLSSQRLPLVLCSSLSAAYLFHLFCDAISGGINWMYPMRNFIWGDYWIGPMLWIPLDVIFILLCYYIFRLRSLLKTRRNLNLM